MSFRAFIVSKRRRLYTAAWICCALWLCAGFLVGVGFEAQSSKVILPSTILGWITVPAVMAYIQAWDLFPSLVKEPFYVWAWYALIFVLQFLYAYLIASLLEFSHFARSLSERLERGEPTLKQLFVPTPRKLQWTFMVEFLLYVLAFPILAIATQLDLHAGSWMFWIFFAGYDAVAWITGLNSSEYSVNHLSHLGRLVAFAFAYLGEFVYVYLLVCLFLYLRGVRARKHRTEEQNSPT